MNAHGMPVLLAWIEEHKNTSSTADVNKKTLRFYWGISEFRAW